MRVTMAVFVVGCLATGFTGVAAKSKTLPKDFKTCTRGDNVCLKQSIAGAVKLIASHGIPSLNVKPIDPFFVEKAPIQQGAIKLVLTDQEVTGLSMTDIVEVRSEMDDKNHLLDVQIHVPKLAVRGNYIIGGRILVLPITGNGKNNLTLTDLRCRVVLRGHVTQRDGEEFIQVDDHLVTMEVGRVYIDFENMFNGNRLLADNMAVVLNDNWRVILDEVRPAVLATMGDIVKGVVDNVYAQVPYPILYPKP